MASTPGAATAPRATDPATAAAAAAATSPVAVVWCRQVDNEAESPGYTTVPEEFPGLRETLDAIRIVGHLTVNVADTHDYWDPDPAQPLSYYPNIFLYPASGGRYTCLGRMFLSTEDRPRLGMKTLVLDTQQLLATGDFGGTILRWHASMGGARADGSRPPPVPDPRLYDLLGEGFLFHKGTTEPLVAVASDTWEASMQVVLDLIRRLPASLVALGAILAFPYFLPQPKTNLHEFTEQVPLALALMRVPRGEASGDRHAKRMESWESAPVTVRDLTAPLPTTPKGKDPTPLVLQYARDRTGDKLAPIVKRVDLVELPRLGPHLADADRQAGRDRRKEMWRIGTAMESAALLLQRARGRHVAVPVETAKRAQEYLQARLPDAPERAGITAAAPNFAGGEVTAPSLHPPWLQRGIAPAEIPSTAPAAPAPTREVVPVSVSEDPSLLTAEQRPAPPPIVPPEAAPGPVRAPNAVANPARIGPPPGAALTVPPPSSSELLDPEPAPPRAPTSTAASPSGVPAAVATPPLVRSPAVVPLAVATPPAPPPITSADLEALRASVTREIAQLLDARLAAAKAELPALPEGLDASAQDELRAQLRASREALLADVMGQLAVVQDRVAREQAALESRWKAALAEAVGPTVDRKLGERVDPKIAELAARADQAGRAAGEAAAARLAADFATLRTQVTTSVAASEETLRNALTSQVAQHFDDAAEREIATANAVETRLTASAEDRFKEFETRRQRETIGLEQRVAAVADQKFTDLELRRAKDAREVEARLLLALDKRQADADARRAKETTELEARLAVAADRRAADEKAARGRETAELEARLAGAGDRRSGEEKSLRGRELTELEARLLLAADKRAAEERGVRARELAELEARVAVAAAVRDQAAAERRGPEERATRGRELAELEARVSATTAAKDRLAADTRAAEIAELESRLAQRIEARAHELEAKIPTGPAPEPGLPAAVVEDRISQQEALLERKADALRSELTDAQVRAIADLQVRLQAYTDQKLREDVDRERQKYLELLARLRTEVDSSLGRLVESTKFEQSIREKVDRGLAAERAELDRLVESRAARSEEALRAEVGDLRERLVRLDAGAGGRAEELAKLEASLRSELDDLDRRAQILADRLVPVVRRTWARITELEAAAPAAPSKELVEQMRQQIDREVRRLEGEIGDRIGEIRDRMETAISNQGRVWLTLVRQLSQLTEDRRVIEEGKALLRERTPGRDESTSLEALPSLLQARRGTPAAAADEPDDEGETERARRRRRTSSSTYPR